MKSRKTPGDRIGAFGSRVFSPIGRATGRAFAPLFKWFRERPSAQGTLLVSPTLLWMIALLIITSLTGIVSIGIAIIFHEGSTLVVVANALRLLGYKDAHI